MIIYCKNYKKYIKKQTFLFLLIIGTILYTGCIGPGLGDYEYDIAGSYKVIRTSVHEVSITTLGSSKTVVPAKVVEIAWDQKFIIAKQLPLIKNDDSNVPIPDENTINFWIIDTSDAKVYGPLANEDFEKNKLTLGVPEDLILISRLYK